MKWIAVPVLACLPALAQTGGYSGPEILSRLANTTGERGGVATGFQFYAGVNGTYETGYVPASVDAAGHITTPGGLYGVFANIGAYGRHKWRHTAFGLDYSGNFRHYTTNSSLDGSDHMLGLSISTPTLATPAAIFPNERRHILAILRRWTRDGYRPVVFARLRRLR